MPTDHCSHCQPGKRCGNGHLYVVQLKHEKRSARPRLYVGQTGKSVEERSKDNLKRKDGSFVHSFDEAKRIGEDGGWHYQSKSIKKLRQLYDGLRPDLYVHLNPLIRSSYHSDPNMFKRREEELAKDLEGRGFIVLWG